LKDAAMALVTHKLAARFSGATAVAAAFSLLAVPAAAVDLPRPATAQAYDGEALNAERHRRWRHDRNDIDTGDVVAGVVILGAIAAIAGAANNRRDRNRYEGRYPRPNDDYGYRTPGGYERSDSRGIDRAVDMCVDEVERGQARVGSVDSATRSGDGWHISGELENGAPYSCTIDSDGRIDDVDLGSSGYGSAPGQAAGDAEYDDDYYSRAREDQSSAEPHPDSDGRYETARAPDFAQ
jgi:hypothetical protein